MNTEDDDNETKSLQEQLNLCLLLDSFDLENVCICHVKKKTVHVNFNDENA